MTAPPPEPPLPPGWEKMNDQPTVYYKNSSLGVEQADRPGLPENPAVGAILCGASLPLDPVAAECSANAPPPPLKAYLLSILTPILEESANALFETLRVKPYELAETAVSDAVMSQALTPEVLARMKALNDPQVQQVLANFKANVQTAVQASADILNKGVGDNIGELLGSIVNKLSSAIQLLIADLPGWGVVMSGAELADTALLAVKQGEEIADEVQHALEPLNAIGAQVAQVRRAVDAATNEVPVTPSATTASVVSEADETADKIGNEAPENAVPVTPSEATASVVSAVPPKKGGSRKRRRIHKVSRRIERTLRRVQKKYGLRDKNDFLRRTLRVRKK